MEPSPPAAYASFGAAKVSSAVSAATRIETPMTPRELVTRWVDAFNRADPDALAGFYTDDAVNHQVDRHADRQPRAPQPGSLGEPYGVKQSSTSDGRKDP